MNKKEKAFVRSLTKPPARVRVIYYRDNTGLVRELRLSAAEHAKLQAIAARLRLTISQTISHAINHVLK